MGMRQEDSDIYNAALVRFWSREKAIGAGILVGDDKSKPYILTCAHVVKASLEENNSNFVDAAPFDPPSDKIPNDSVSIDFPVIGTVQKQEIQVAWWKTTNTFPPDKGKDIAILRLGNQIQLHEKIKSLKLSKITGDLNNHSVDIGGFPTEAQMENSVETQSTKIKPISIFSKGTINYTSEGLVEIENNKENDYALQSGFSGSPVWDNEIQKVVGIFTTVGDKKNWMIPNESISSSIPIEFKELFFESEPQILPNSDLETIKIEPIGEFKELIKTIVNGNIIPFLGAGINPFIYVELCSRLSNLVWEDLNIKLPNGQNWNSLNNESLKRQILVKQLIGIPSTICPLLTKERPDPCPIVDQIKRIWTNPLFIEQELVIAKLNFRYLAQYFRLKRANLDNFYIDIRDLSQVMNKWPDLDKLPQAFRTLICESYQSDHLNNFDLENFKKELADKRKWSDDLKRLVEQFSEQVNQQVEVHKFFAQLPNKMLKKGYPRKKHLLGLPYPVIFTTKIDSWLEFALNNYASEEDSNFKQPFETVYYKILDDSGNREGSFIHLERGSEISKDYEYLPVYVTGSSSDNFKPVIIRLSGNWDDNFVMTNEHFYNLLNDLKELPADLTNLIKTRNILFLGYSPTDYELQLIVDQLQKLDIINNKNITSWLIYQSTSNNLGKLAEKIWENHNIKLISVKGSWAYFVAELQKGIDKRIQELKKGGG